MTAERLVSAVATAYYGRNGARGTRDGLGPVMDVIDRASPGVVELGTGPGGAGFEIRLAERPFPQQWEGELRRAAEAVLTAGERREKEGLIARVVAALQRLFTASV